LFAVAAVTFGIVAMLLASGFIEWSLWYGRDAVIRAQLGHFQVTRKDYYERGVADPFNYLLPRSSAEFNRIEAIDGVEVVAPRMSLTGLASHDDATLSFMGEGVEPERDVRLSGAIRIVEGENLSAEEPDGVVIGRGLAANLGVSVGDSLVLLSSPSSGGASAAEVRIRGIFGTIMRGYDDAVIRMPMSVAAQLTRSEGAQVWAVLLSDEGLLPEALSSARDAVKNADMEVISWRELSDFYTKTEALMKSQLGGVRLIIGVIIVLCIANTMYMSVIERTVEIGTVLAIGTPRREVMMLFLIEGAMLGVAGAIVGMVLGGILAVLISAVGIPMPAPPGGGDPYLAGIRIEVPMLVEALVLAVSAAVLASVVPARKASRQVIVDALRRAAT